MDTDRYRLSSPVSLLWRPHGALQVGLDTSLAVLLPGAPDGADVALRALRTSRTVTEVAHLAPAVPLPWIREALATLAALGIVTTATDPPASLPTIMVVGDGALAHAVAGLLRDEQRAVTVASMTPHHPRPDELIVLCTDTAEPDRVDVRDLTASGTTHLIVRAEPERAVVGPFVSAGSGHACLTCTDLVRRDLDRAWPHLLAQLCRTRHTATPQQCAWAAALASAQVAAWVGGRTPEASGTTWEMDARTGQIGVRRWPRHPDCGCALTR
ncbi:MAG: hypothetical protein QM708_15920 [Propioniciclava sp.]|uniref:hypothetical protein n=1 Tax=Propioniciclava sp. TaxID=2038686 RepID=UPI0039E50947